MFKDATKYRSPIFPEDMDEPITEKELYNITRIQYRIDPLTKKTLPHVSKYREKWIKLFE